MEIIIRGSPSDIALLLGLIQHQDESLAEENVPPEIMVRGFTADAGDQGEDRKREGVTL